MLQSSPAATANQPKAVVAGNVYHVLIADIPVHRLARGECRGVH